MLLIEKLIDERVIVIGCKYNKRLATRCHLIIFVVGVSRLMNAALSVTLQAQRGPLSIPLIPLSNSSSSTSPSTSASAHAAVTAVDAALWEEIFIHTHRDRHRQPRRHTYIVIMYTRSRNAGHNMCVSVCSIDRDR